MRMVKCDGWCAGLFSFESVEVTEGHQGLRYFCQPCNLIRVIKIEAGVHRSFNEDPKNDNG